jgi:hypothetical protein
MIIKLQGHLRWLAVIGLLAGFALGVGACGGDDDENFVEVADDGSATIDNERVQNAIEDFPPTELTAEEAAGLLYMREEEKLARDVYGELAKSAGQPIFSNIGRSEQTHMEAVKVLLDRYGLPDPAATTGAGQFQDADLQRLYDQLISQGKTSSEQALRAGALIEEVDIIDLEERISQTDDRAIQLVYENLRLGSENHLRAFVSTLGRLGVEYQPTRLSQEVYDEVMGDD